MDRAQSEVVGSVLIIGLVVISVSVAGAAALGTVVPAIDEPRADIASEVRTDGLALSHRGGDALASDELRLIVRVNGSETSLFWTNGTLSGGDDEFDPGESWTVSRSYDPDASVTVRIAHAPTNTIILRLEANPTTPESVVSEMGGKIDAVDSEGDGRLENDDDDDDGD